MSQIVNQESFEIRVYSLANVGIGETIQKMKCGYDEALELLVLYFSIDEAKRLLDEAVECLTPRVRTISDVCGITVSTPEWNEFKRDLN